MIVNHTPSPWYMFSTPVGVGVTSHAGADVAHCSGFDTDRTRAEEEANARLQAASPDLLVALVALYEDYKALIAMTDGGHCRLEDSDVGKQAVAAIRKATTVVE